MRMMRRGLGALAVALLATSAIGIGQAGATFEVRGLGPADLWVGLKNSDDQGTSFDIQVELTSIETGEGGTIIARCVTGVTRNASLAKEVSSFDSHEWAAGVFAGAFRAKISTRIGTNADNTKCGSGHNSATGLRLYYDAATRASNFTFHFSGFNDEAYLHSNGNPCNNAPSTGVSARTFNQSPPDASTAKCKDSAGINFAGGNPWQEIGTWTGNIPDDF